MDVEFLNSTSEKLGAFFAYEIFQAFEGSPIGKSVHSV